MHYGHSVKYDLPGLDHMPTTKADRWRQHFPNHKPEIGERAVPQIEKKKKKQAWLLFPEGEQTFVRKTIDFHKLSAN